MCRMYFQTNNFLSEEKLNDIFITLCRISGGDGQGIVTTPNTVDILKSYTIKDREFKVDNTFDVYTRVFNDKIYVLKTLAPYSKFKFGGIKWLFYHTRKASLGSVNIENTHPVVNDKWLVMQNGHEPKFIDFAHLMYPGINIETDTHAVLQLLTRTPEYTLSILRTMSTSNWFIIDTEKQRFYIIINSHYGIYEYKPNDNNIILCSDDLIDEYDMKYVVKGYIAGTMTNNGAVIEVYDTDYYNETEWDDTTLFLERNA